MTDRRREIDRLCGDALFLEGDARAAFLEAACGADEELRREIDALLECERDASGFLERPALHQLAEAIAADATSRVGRDVGGYRVDSLLGTGGMGEVYRARDLTLERDVALKVLERFSGGEEGVRRFEDEARAASRLNHPNIVTIYGAGEAGDAAYIAMELVDGRTLRDILVDGPIAPAGALDLAVQLADALAAAHAVGIVHRDLTPDNVMVTTGGLVKILDFGIATRGHGRADEGVILGTVGYMSPEQATGGQVDARSDQFSFGTILYELLSGQRAFDRPTKTETLAAIVSAAPAPLPAGGDPLATAMGQVMNRCLAKDPDQRFLSTRELSGRLREVRDESRRTAEGALLSRRQAVWLTAAAVAAGAAGIMTGRFWLAGPTVRRLAVLPFANPTEDEGTEYLCDGLADSLIRRLSLIPTLEVKALSAVMHFKGRGVDAPAAGRQLNADAVLTGSVTRRAGRLLVDAELVDVSKATRLWGTRFDRPQADVLAVHDEIAAAIVRDGLGVDDLPVPRALTTDPVAYDLYLQAVHHFRLQLEEEYLAARSLLIQAVARDRAFALAHVTLASTYSVMAIDGFEAPLSAWPESTKSVARALELDADLPDAHAEASAAAFYYRWDWDEADREWEIALSSRRGEVQAELLGSRALQTWALGRNEDALKFARAARLADPLNADGTLREADLLMRVGQTDGAAALYEKVIADLPDDPRAYFGLADVRRAQGRFDEAIEVRRRTRIADPDDAVSGRGAEGYEQLEREEARWQLEGLQARAKTGAYVSPLDYARVHARLGEPGPAFEYLTASFDHRAAGLVFLRVDPAWQRLRGDPRLQDAIRKVGLPQV